MFGDPFALRLDAQGTGSGDRGSVASIGFPPKGLDVVEAQSLTC